MSMMKRKRTARRAPGQELKVVDHQLDTLPSGALDARSSSEIGIRECAAIAEGTGYYERIGRKVNLESLRVRVHVHVRRFPLKLDSAGNDYNHRQGNVVYRQVIVWDKAPRGQTNLVYGDVFGFTKPDGTEAYSQVGAIRADVMDRFRILRDDIHILNPPYGEGKGFDQSVGLGQETSITPAGDYFFEQYVSLKGLQTTYRGPTDGPESIETGGLYVFMMAWSNTIVGPPYDDLNQFQIETTGNSFARLRYFE